MGVTPAATSLFVAWTGFCFNSNVANNCKADAVLMTVTFICVMVDVVQLIRSDAYGSNSVKQIASIAVPAWIGVVSSYVGIFVV